MDIEDQIDCLNEDCILETLKCLNLASILEFGITNKRFHLVTYINSQHQIHGMLRFVLDGSLIIIREILLRFGHFSNHFDVNFGLQNIDMDVFQNCGGCLIDRAQSLILRYDLIEDDECDRYFQFTQNYSISRLASQYNQLVENIISNINADQFQSLSNISFICSVALQPGTFP